MASKQRPLRGNTNLKSNSGSDIEVYVEVEKDTEPGSEDGIISFEVGGDGDTLDNIKKVQIKAPSGKKSILKNGLGFGGSEFSYESDYEVLHRKFPEGRYLITFSPKKYGNITINITYDFPSTPVITYPEDGAANVPLNFTIEWELLDDIDRLRLNVEGHENDEIDFEKELSIDATSFTLPEGLLQPNHQYQIELKAFKDGENVSISTRSIYFTTGSE
jgi:hypothetical protein